VLSRADEVGVGRLDALLAAETAARRMSADPRVRAVSSAVVPVAGLLALAGRTLRHGDYVALRALADADQSQVSRVLLTADRFTRPDAPVPLSAEVRAALLDRLGLFGIRLSIALVRTGVPDAGALAEELLQRSGLAELQRLLRVHFTDRGAQLRAGTALRLLESVLAEHPVAGDGELRAGLERLRLATPDLAELDLLARSRAAGSPLPADLRAEGERLLGAEGTGPRRPARVARRRPGRRAADRRAGGTGPLADAADDPLAVREAADAAEVVVRACEALLAELDGSAPVVVGGLGPGGRAAGRGRARTGRRPASSAHRPGRRPPATTACATPRAATAGTAVSSSAQRAHPRPRRSSAAHSSETATSAATPPSTSTRVACTPSATRSAGAVGSSAVASAASR
jgi:hypothetical protein